MINIVTGISYYKNDSRLQGFNMNENLNDYPGTQVSVF